MTQVTVRVGLDPEAEAIRRILAAAYGQYEADLPPENWQRYLADIIDIEGRSEVSELLVAEREGAVVGCVSHYPPGLEVTYPSDDFTEHFPADWSAIRLLAVDPTARGGGIGRLLTEACIARSREQGASGVGLHTMGAMAVARAMYERMGFERAPTYDFRPTPDLLVEAYRLIL